MRLAILADIHGNLPALVAVLEDVTKQNVDRLLVAGDLTGGPQSQEAVDRIRALDGWMVRGNREAYLTVYDAGTAPQYWHESEQWAALRWEHRHLDRATLDWVASLPGPRPFVSDHAAPILVVHGSPQSDREALFPETEAGLDRYRAAGFTDDALEPHKLTKVLASLVEPALICAHTHIPWVQEQKGQLVVNPGSVGASLNGDPRARYALLEWGDGRWQAVHRAVPYELERVRRAFEESGYLAYGGPYARAWLRSVVTGRYVWGVFLAHARRLASESETAGGGDAERQATIAGVWDRAVATFDWDRYER